jgi:hypothetical protein
MKLTMTCPRCRQTMDARTTNHGDVCPARVRPGETPEQHRDRLRRYPRADDKRA